MSTINLLPDDYLLRRCQRRANVLCVILFAVVMAGVGGAALVSEQNTRRTIQVRDHVNASYDEAAKLLAQMQQLEAQKRTGIQKAHATASLLERVPRSYLLAAVSSALPDNTAVMRLDMKPSRRVAAPEPAPTRGRNPKYDALKSAAAAAAHRQPVMEMEIVGWAATDVQVARFIANLLRDPLLSNVELGYSQEKVVRAGRAGGEGNLQVREFMVTVQLRSDVDVMDLVNYQQPSQAAPAPVELRQDSEEQGAEL